MLTAAGEGITAEVGRLGAFDHLDPFHIGKWQDAPATAHERAIPKQGAGLRRRGNDLLMHTAKANRWVPAAGRGGGALELQPGHKRGQVLAVIDACPFQTILGDSGHGNRNLKNIFGALARGHYDLFDVVLRDRL